jgi:uncharacterized protein (TIGR02466 family)
MPAWFGSVMMVRQLFATPFYVGTIDDPGVIADLDHSCRTLARDDRAGRQWAKANGYAGYTSYASLTDLPQRDPAFAELKRLLAGHVAAFVEAAHLDIGAKRLKLDSLWVNVLKPGGGHSGHIHPHSIVSGTFYVAVPPGSGALKLEDPRLPMLMASPGRRADAPEEVRNFVYAEPVAGSVFLWESWLRHEVMPSTAKAERISISFNYS